MTRGPVGEARIIPSMQSLARLASWSFLLIGACSDGGAAATDAAVPTPDAPLAIGGGAYPEPGAFPQNRGPGGPTRTFTDAELRAGCAFLSGGPTDYDHHNLVLMLDGYLLLPWSPEFGTGGLTFFDVSDPCAPVAVGRGTSVTMRETHSVGVARLGGRTYAVVNQFTSQGTGNGGIQFWDVTDSTAPVAIADLELPGFGYPDAYARVTLSVFWQAPYVYVAGADNGIYVVDATDPTQPRFVTQVVFDPVMRAGQVVVVGNLLFTSSAEGPRAVLLDVSDPAAPQPIPGGDFVSADEDGNPRETYFSNFADGYAWFARKEGGGGLIVYDLRDPTRPTRAGGITSEGNGGYVFIKEGFAFTGESSFAAVYDVRDLTAITDVGRLTMVGDLDTAVPIGNVVVLSVDGDSEPDQASTIVPWQAEPDRTPPRVTHTVPADGATGLPLTSRIGIMWSEAVDSASAWAGSVRVYPTGSDPAATRVNGWVSAQDSVVSFFPYAPLRAGVEYTVELPAGGVTDWNGNAAAETVRFGFTTVGP